MKKDNNLTNTVKSIKELNQKIPYKKPKLTNYGKIKSLTMGPSPGGGESGNPMIFMVSM
ncbi:MAG: hypothetical protein ACR2NW_00015 [Thermodesulfobacteriota bacterium]